MESKVFCLGECVIEHELRMEDSSKSKKAGEHVMLSLTTVDERSPDEACAICYYDSATEEKDETLEREFAKKPVQPAIGRYASLSITPREESVEGQVVCSHVFHTMCLHKWVGTEGNVGGFTCPVCRGGLQKQRIRGVPDLFEAAPPQPEFVTKFWENGGPKEQYYELRGMKEGPYKSFYATGHVELERTYVKGLRVGTERHYYDDVSHAVKSLVDFKDDKKHGCSQWFTANGKMIGKAHYEEGEKHGSHLEWYTDCDVPRLRSMEHHHHGKRHGIFLKWSYSGKLLLYGVYVNDEKDGRFCAWYEQHYGLKIKEYFINGLRHGMSVEYYEPDDDATKTRPVTLTPRPKEIGTFDHGARVGVWRLYWTNGVLRSETEYNGEGERDGIHREWTRFGRLSKCFRYEADQLDGTCETYDESLPPNVPIETATYRQGQLHGIYVLRYKTTGRPKIIKNYNFQQEVFMRWISRSGETLSEYHDGVEQPPREAPPPAVRIPQQQQQQKSLKPRDDVIHIKRQQNNNSHDHPHTQARFI